MKQLGLGITQYTQDYDEQFPPFQVYVSSSNQYFWHDLIYPYVKNTQAYNCPSRVYGSGEGPVTTTNVKSYFNLECLSIGSGKSTSYSANRAYYNGSAQPSCTGSSCPNYSNPRVGATTPFTGGSATTLMSISRISKPSQTIALLEGDGSYIGNASSLGSDLLGNGSSSFEVYRHLEMTNVLFCDGHAKAMNKDALTDTHDVKTGSVLIPVAYLFTTQDD